MKIDDLICVYLKIEYSHPLINDDKTEYWSIISCSALPDGAHHRDKDLILFHVQHENQQTLFGISSYRQIDANVCLFIVFLLRLFEVFFSSLI